MNTYNEELVQQAKERRARNEARLRRRMELGYDGWQKRPDGSFFKSTPKGIQNWYTTAQLVRLVTEAFDQNEKTAGRRMCYINGKWRLQIRGKHLRRLLKAMPNVKQEGRMLVEHNNG